jgi:hypothetical protein
MQPVACYAPDEATVIPAQPAAFDQRSCSDQELVVINSVCFGQNRNDQACEQVLSQQTRCTSCLLQGPFSPVLLPVGQGVTVNYPACMALSVGCTPLEAGQSAAEQSCAISACQSCPDFEIDRCIQDSQRLVCAGTATSASCKAKLENPALGDAAQQACGLVPGATFESVFAVLSKKFCGGIVVPPPPPPPPPVMP